MDNRFAEFVESLQPSFQRLAAMSPVKVESLPKAMPKAGIYLFSENERHLYVGRSNRIRQRLQEHCRPSATHNSAPFAFRLARRSTGRTAATYKSDGSRKELEEDPQFKEAFAQAKQRVRRMDVRYVEERNPLKQALLEIYAAVALDTPHNDFDTH